MFQSFEIIYRFILKIVFAFFTALFALAAFGLAYLMFNDVVWQILSVFMGTIVGIVVSSYLYVILLIPYMISKEFDVIQNKVALRAYKTTEDFQKEIAEFIIQFFKYPGAQIHGGIFNFKNCPPLIINPSENKIVESDIKLDTSNKKSCFTKINNHKAVYIPIGFEGQDLGYMILIPKGKSLPIFKNILTDFENYYLDDQLMHVINQTAS